MGFLGGISWSIMTALICIQHPEANCVEIIRQFFLKYNEMELDDFNEIKLDDALYADMYGPNQKEYISEYSRNEFTEIMPILTPTRPAMNCAYNVIASTKYVILNEIKRAFHLTIPHNINWKELFSKRPLIARSKSIYSDDENVYIRIQCIPDSTNLFSKQWTGFIESKIRNLVKKLNRDLFDSTFYPFANSIKSTHSNIENFFISGKYSIDFDHRQNNEDAINMALQQFQHQIDHSSVRLKSGLKCSLKLDVYHQSQIHAVLDKIKQPQLNGPNINNIHYIQYNNYTVPTYNVVHHHYHHHHHQQNKSQQKKKENNNNNDSPSAEIHSFPLPNIANISSFPIIKIQQPGLPHLPPFVTTTNAHYPLVANATNNTFNNVKYNNYIPPPYQYWVIIPIHPHSYNQTQG